MRKPGTPSPQATRYFILLPPALSYARRRPYLFCVMMIPIDIELCVEREGRVSGAAQGMTKSCQFVDVVNPPCNEAI